MTVTEFISTVPANRQSLMTVLHDAIMANDKTVVPVIKPMMGVTLILYEERCYMKYGLASVSKYMSLHCLPMYMNAALHAKYQPLLPNAKFQKGCINFNGDEMSVAIASQLIADFAKISIADMLENRNKSKKVKAKS